MGCLFTLKPYAPWVDGAFLLRNFITYVKQSIAGAGTVRTQYLLLTRFIRPLPAWMKELD